MQVYFENSFVRLSYDREIRMGKAEWNGRLQGPELREAFLICLDMIDRFLLIRWLADDRRMEMISPDDLAWSVDVYVPRLTSTSLRRMARLPSECEKNRHAVEVMIERGNSLDYALILRDFLDEQQALAWLLEPVR